jgi:hydrogenase expression/formation protein HypC
MCLGVPGRIESVFEFKSEAESETKDSSPALSPERSSISTKTLGQRGRVSFGAITQEVHLGFVPEAKVGDYVIVHVGVAISCLDEAEALRTLELIRALEEGSTP